MTKHQIYRTATRLADGRELIYFDEAPGKDRSARDVRDLPAVEHRSEVRFDALADEWVTIAGHRQTRTYRPPADACPLCPSAPGRPTEIPAADYDVVVFENRFPSFSGSDVSVGRERRDAAFEPHPGSGRCEVVCFTADHHATMSELSDTRVRTVVEVWTDRTCALARQPGIRQVFCFENRGIEIGVTLDHPHGQIYGYPFVTPATSRMLAAVKRHRRAHGGNLFADLLAMEADGPRVVARNEHWIAFVPFAARWPVEVHVYPRRRVPDLPALTDDERDALVPIYRECLRRMEGLIDEPLPAITAWHQAPAHTGRGAWWAHLRLTSIRRAPGKIKYLAGSEAGMGAFINDVAPEDAAARLKEVAL